MTGKLFNVAVAGATGAVGNQMITCLEEMNFPVKSIKFFSVKTIRGAERSNSREIRWRFPN